MTKKELMAIVDANVKKMKWATMTNMWHISFKYEFTEDGNLAWTEMEPDYNRAVITFNSKAFKKAKESDVLETLRHELLHLHLGRLDKVIESMAGQLPHKTAQAYIDWYHGAIERCVMGIENLLDHGCGVTPEKMAAQEFSEIVAENKRGDKDGCV